MGIPTGAGTEVLNNIPKNGLSNAWWTGSDVTVPSDHIWTILSIIICSVSSSTSNIGLRMIPGSAPDSGQTIDLIANTILLVILIFLLRLVENINLVVYNLL